MKEVIQLVRVWDDLHRADGEEIEAEVTDVVLQLGRRKVTLDLTARHHEELRSFLEPFLAAGTRQATEKNPAPVRDPAKQAARQRGMAKRAFGDKYGLAYKEYKRSNGGSGGFKYSEELEEAFAIYEATGKVPRVAKAS